MATTLPTGALAPGQTEQVGSKKAVSLIDSLLSTPSLPQGTSITPQAQNVQTNELLSTPGVTGTLAAQAGAGLINDVRALQRDGALQAAADTGLPICLMHIKGEPKTMQQAPCYADLLADIGAYFAERIQACEAVNISREKLILDPGFGFGKTLQHNLQLLRDMQQLPTFGLPLLVGMSRKSMIGNTLNKPLNERLYGGLAVAVLAFERGASIVRTHDVGATVDALQMTQAVLHSKM